MDGEYRDATIASEKSTQRANDVLFDNTSVRFERSYIAVTAALCGVGLLVSLAINYPGFMGYDSIEQLLDARGGVYTDWHPPVLALTWRYLDRIVPGPFLMLVLQTTVIWFGTALVTLAWFKPRQEPRFWIIVPTLIVLYPPVFGITGAVWKDIPMWAFFILAIGIAGLTRPLAEDGRLRFALKFAACSAALGIAITMRYNAVFAAIPILALCIARAIGFKLPRLLVAGTVAVGVCGLLAVAATGIGARIATLHRQPWIAAAIFDISGVIAKLPDRDEQEAIYDAIPERIHADGGLDKLLTIYPSYYWETPFAEDRDSGAFGCPLGPESPSLHHMSRFDTCFLVTPEESHTMRTLWLTTIARHPGLWLLHRALEFRHVIGSNDTHLWDAVFMGQAGSHAAKNAALASLVFGDHIPQLNAFQRQFFGFLDQHLSQCLVYRTWIYFLLTCTVFAICLARWDETHLQIALIAGSGVAHELGLFFMAPSPDFRYSHHMIYVSLLAAALLLRAEFARRAARARTHDILELFPEAARP